MSDDSVDSQSNYSYSSLSTESTVASDEKDVEWWQDNSVCVVLLYNKCLCFGIYL